MCSGLFVLRRNSKRNADAMIKIFRELKELGYISMVTRGKWKLSDKTSEIIRITKRL